ncbi:MAG: Ig-like domain-containing protein, partial [Aquihabitans sp.]
VSAGTLGLGNITMNSDCTFQWDATAPGNGTVEFVFRVCDDHKLLANVGTNAVKDGEYTWGDPSDLSDTASRRCTDGFAKLIISNSIVLPPIGVTDIDVVDAGYSGDDVGPYTVAIPVLDNDIDNNGPKPTTVSVLTPPDPSEGTTAMFGKSVFFTPADGFSGPVSFTYRVCEDPALQNPPYDGFPFCGVGQVLIDVVANNAPVLVNDGAFLFPDDTIDGLDLAANDVEPDGEALTCATTPVNVSDPAKVASLSISSDCLLDLDAVDGAEGFIDITYQACDDHVLSTPAHPAPLYGADDRNPGDVAPRCSTAVATVALQKLFVIGVPDTKPVIEPGPTDAYPEPTDNGENPNGNGNGNGSGSGTQNPGGSNTGSGNRPAGTPGPAAVITTASLPRTGSNTIGIASLGMALLAGGLVVDQIRRKKTT